MGRSLSGFLLSALMLPGSACALGFGDIRLKSALNAPLDAEIEISATPDELGSLRAGLASREQFVRNGMDYPAFLNSATVRLAKTADGRNVLQVHTADPVTEPFLTMLVQVSYARGQLIREYTVLLDPPVFANQSGSAAVSAPSAGAQLRSGDVDRGTASTAPTPAPAQPAASRPSGAAAVSSYRVRPGDTLSAIAGSRYPRVNREAALLGLYRANPQAFDGNMNALRRDALLSLPAEDDLARVGPGEARTEVASQYRAWADQRGSGRLRLVPPSESAQSAVSGSQTASLQQRVAELEQQLAEKERLLTLRNAELARLQQGVGATQAAAASSAASVASSVASTSQPDAPAVAPVQAPAVAAPKPAPKVAPPAEPEFSLLDWVLENWYVPVAGVALLSALALFMRSRRARQDAYGDRRFDQLGTATGGFGESSQTLPARPLPHAVESIVVEESGGHRQDGSGDVLEASGIPMSDEGAAAMELPAMSGDGAGVDQGDPLAEADFHMAYGLYDQAADLVNLAITREPGRRELKLKLLEVYFVWGNKQKFEQLAAELAESRDGAVPGEWEKIVIMGRQIAPDNALFAASAGLAAAAGSVDLNLEGGQNRVDFNLMGDSSAGAAESDGVDLDLGDVLPDQPGVEVGARPAGESGVDFLLDTPVRGEGGELLTQLMPAGALQSLRDEGLPGDTATAEIPRLDAPGQGTIRMKLDGPAAKPAAAESSTDNTAELALDDLGLDIGTMEPATGGGHPEEIVLEAAMDGDALSDLESGPEGNWLLQGTEDSSEHAMLPEDLAREAVALQAPASPAVESPAASVAPGQSVGQGGDGHEEPADLLAAEIDAALSGMPIPDGGFAQASSQLDDLSQPESDTQLLMQQQEPEARDLESLPGFEAAAGITAVMPSPESQQATSAVTSRLVSLGMTDNEISVQLGGARASPVAPAVLPEMDPPTMSEVGTKLDLARAYMDMGDPEGARSILDEVLAEGSASQKQEARRLIDSLPG